MLTINHRSDKLAATKKLPLLTAFIKPYNSPLYHSLLCFYYLFVLYNSSIFASYYRRQLSIRASMLLFITYKHSSF